MAKLKNVVVKNIIQMAKFKNSGTYYGQKLLNKENIGRYILLKKKKISSVNQLLGLLSRNLYSLKYFFYHIPTLTSMTINFREEY